MHNVTLYSDGACSGNPGPGGWCCILECKGVEKMLSGHEKNTTNNRMELTAVISGLDALNVPCIVDIFSDSKYIVDSVTKGWLRNWEARRWVKQGNIPVPNTDLWKEFLEVSSSHTINWHWVKGHADNVKNNRCDKQAVKESMIAKREG